MTIKRRLAGLGTMTLLGKAKNNSMQIALFKWKARDEKAVYRLMITDPAKETVKFSDDYPTLIEARETAKSLLKN